jgi:hypothetical protein
MSYRPDHIAVFAGPSLPGWRAAAPFAALPPAAAGDLLRLAAGPACTMVLIDGLFGTRPSVWHKEVLVLLARGFRVIGAASMGALRAAELAPFGMIGSGAIFSAYASGQLTGDDEVAVIHAPAALGSAALSLAQIDVRATLQAAVRRRIITAAAARQLRSVSAAIHYRDRDWPALFEAAGTPPVAAAAIEGAAVNLKQRDALAALALALRLAPVPPVARPMPPVTPFLVRLMAHAGVDDATAIPPPVNALRPPSH